MTSLLIIAPVDEIQGRINSITKFFRDAPRIYVSLNKTQNSIESIFKKNRIDLSKLFFIDCFSSEKTKEDVLYISPTDLDLLSCAIDAFIKSIKTEKFLIIDSLSILLIYNNEKKVIKFVKDITEYASQEGIQLIVFSPKTEDDKLLNEVFNFFDKVEQV